MHAFVRRALMASLLSPMMTGAVALAAAPGAGFPVKPIRMIMPNAPGSGTDTLGRILAIALGEEQCLGGGGRPVLEPVADAARERLQRQRVAQHEAPVGPRFHLHPRRCQCLIVAEREVVHGVVSCAAAGDVATGS